MMRHLVLLDFLFKMISFISLVEILFRNNIKTTRCQAKCLERVRCAIICARPLCALAVRSLRGSWDLNDVVIVVAGYVDPHHRQPRPGHRS